MPLFTQKYPFQRFSLNIKHKHAIELLAIPNEKEFHITCDSIIEHLPNVMAGEFWNLFYNHRELWKNKQIVFPASFTRNKIKERYKYIENAVIEYKKKQAGYKKKKSFPFVFTDHRKNIPKRTPKKKSARKRTV